MGPSELIACARDIAMRAHAKQLRKAPALPYMVHLESVVGTLRHHGYTDEEQLSAAYLHDVFEDQPEYANEVRARMPHAVVEIIEALTETKLDAAGHKRPKAERFADLLSNLSEDCELVRRALPISCADKLDNTLSLVEAERTGHKLLLRLNTRPGEHRRHLAQLRALYARSVRPSLLAAFDEAARSLESTIAAWLPGRAVMLAAEAHLGQYDRAGRPFIFHPMRLACAAHSDAQRMVAVLHDVVENASWSLPSLKSEGFPDEVVDAIDHLTRRLEESYDDFIERVAEHRLATQVKLLDLRDNIQLMQRAPTSDEDPNTLAKYERALARLERELRKRSLWIELDQESKQRLQALANLPVVKADHITLAHRIVPEELTPNMIPAGHQVGDRVQGVATRDCSDGRVQAVIVEIEGSSKRPFDAAILHVTVSRTEDASAKDANRMLLGAPQSTCEIPLSGVVRWVDA